MLNLLKAFGPLSSSVIEQSPFSSLVCELTVDNFKCGHQFSDRAEVAALGDDWVSVEPHSFDVGEGHNNLCDFIWVQNLVSNHAELLKRVRELKLSQ